MSKWDYLIYNFNEVNLQILVRRKQNLGLVMKINNYNKNYIMKEDKLTECFNNLNNWIIKITTIIIQYQIQSV